MRYGVQVVKLVRFIGSVEIDADSPSDALAKARLAIAHGEIQTTDADWQDQEYINWSFETSDDAVEMEETTR